MRAQVSSVLASASALPTTLATYAAGRGGREKPLSGNLHECRAEQGKAERGRGVVLIAQKNNVACAQPVITSGCTHALTHSLAGSLVESECVCECIHECACDSIA